MSAPNQVKGPSLFLVVTSAMPAAIFGKVKSGDGEGSGIPRSPSRSPTMVASGFQGRRAENDRALWGLRLPGLAGGARRHWKQPVALYMAPAQVQTSTPKLLAQLLRTRAVPLVIAIPIPQPSKTRSLEEGDYRDRLAQARVQNRTRAEVGEV